MESSLNYTPLSRSPEVKQTLSNSLKYFLISGAALIGLALIITAAIFLNRRTQQQNQLTTNQFEPTQEVNKEKQLIPTKQVDSSSSFTTIDAKRLEKALSSQVKDEYSSVYQVAIRELTKNQGAPFPPGTIIDIDPAAFTPSGAGIGTVALSTSGVTNKKYTLYLIREENEWFIYAVEERK